MNCQSGKRTDYIDWADYFMATAILASKRSKDPITQVGACIADKYNRIVGIGYNGMPNGCGDDDFPWGKSDDAVNSKHTYVCHAELNAILNKNSGNLDGCTMYITLFPCHECAKVIIQSRIKEVIYLSAKNSHKITTAASRKMFEAAGVICKQMKPKTSYIEINLDTD